METLLQRITINPQILHGKPYLTREDILACIAYASEAMRFKDIEVTPT